MTEYTWIGKAPDDTIDYCTFNPIETDNERRRYAELGWKWVRFDPDAEGWDAFKRANSD